MTKSPNYEVGFRQMETTTHKTVPSQSSFNDADAFPTTLGDFHNYSTRKRGIGNGIIQAS